MTSELKSATSRANGAKSHGPKTAEGKEKSSHNATTHGFTSKKTIVLACENPDRFQEMLADYAETYQPGCPVEKDLVDEMVACRWRILRLRMMETALMDSEMERELPASETSSRPRLSDGVRFPPPGRRVARHFARLPSRIPPPPHPRTLSPYAPRIAANPKRANDRACGVALPVQPEPPPPPAVDQPVPQSEEKSQNEPTPLAPAARKDRQRSFRAKKIQCISQLKPVWWDRRFRLSR